jgi:hypothetical protein
MTDINDLFSQLPIGDIAKELGVSKEEAAKGVALALPALVSGLHANASDPKGAASLLSALDGKDTSLIEGGISLADVDTADGTKIVKHIFGSATPDVAAKLGGASALGSGMMKKLLPILAPIVLAFVIKQMTGSKAKTTTPSASGGIQDILGGILGGATGGGSSSGGGIGDILGQVLGGAMSGGSAKAGAGNAITDILGGLLGGGTK